jgi:diguanylate cyclase
MTHDYKNAKKAVELMAINNIPPTPANYEFWYHALSGTDVGLTQEVKALLDDGHVITPRDISRLRQNHFGGGDTDRLDEITKTTTYQIESLTSMIMNAGGDAVSYKNALETGQINLEQDMPIEQQRFLIEQMAQATAAMVDKSQKLEAKLAKSSQEVNALRRDLEKARTESRTDMLTGLANRKAFNAYVEAQAARAMADRKPLCVVFADIDHFKKFNDTWGHRLGDEVLRLVGQSLDQMCQGVGFPARFGGEEFVIALPGKDLESAIDIADQIRDFIGSKAVRAKNTQQTVGRITMSLGIAQFNSTDTLESLIERADKALYHAKDSGRNLVCSERDLVTDTTSLEKMRA